jgi:type II secretory pathway pseudopilin PulG
VTGEYRRWRAVGVLAAALLIVLGAGQAWRVLAQQAGANNYVYQDGITAVDLEMDDASARIVPSQDGRVLVSQVSRWTLSAPEITRELDGSTLRISMHCASLVAIGPLGCTTDFVIAVPPATAVTVNGGNSDTNIKGLTGDLKLTASSGSFELAGVSGRLSAQVSSGSVTGTAITSADVEARVSSGSADLTFAAPPQALVMAAGSGSVRALLPPGTGYQIRSSIGSGSRDVAPGLDDPQSTRTITASADSGAVTLQQG